MSAWGLKMVSCLLGFCYWKIFFCIQEEVRGEWRPGANIDGKPTSIAIIVRVKKDFFFFSFYVIVLKRIYLTMSLC